MVQGNREVKSPIRKLFWVSMLLVTNTDGELQLWQQHNMVRLLSLLPIPIVELCYQQHKLDYESPSAVQLTLHSGSALEITNILPHGQGTVFYHVPIIGPSIQIDQLPLFLDDPNNFINSYSLIHDGMLSRLPIDPMSRHWLTREITSRANALMHDASFDSEVVVGNNNKLWLIDVKLQLLSRIEFEESARADFELLMKGLGVRTNSTIGMVPATWSSISRLEQVTFDHNIIEDSSSERSSCAICLGDLPTASYVSRTPCMHVFHVKCIVKWLNHSHYCPICRFEMPAFELSKFTTYVVYN